MTSARDVFIAKSKEYVRAVEALPFLLEELGSKFTRKSALEKGFEKPILDYLVSLKTLRPTSMQDYELNTFCPIYTYLCKDIS